MESTPSGQNSPIAIPSEQTNGNPTPLARPEDFVLWHYLKEAYRIITWNEDAVQRTKDDPLALAFGVCFWVFTNTAVVIVSLSVFRGSLVFPSPAALATILPF